METQTHPTHYPSYESTKDNKINKPMDLSHDLP